ncbi:MAG TPA: glycoside hydrolase family 15 protein [Noviherbaspirillum sp.]|uniref:glycoside hydrolase family 15 protein n=1 Tax=Noviherbaspirillum sp. TaxID=1926288 RepID=UPI002B4743C1|nr:glycoside hydrolase family 15 protein [Noviherbaspirillum sp.]HJV83868.1 glycoside hydrolase family 15 protein [Noviherbaspirillum sp.]
MDAQASRYPSIADYALISDCHCAALISKAGSVDWCCMPRFDADSCFGRLLDWDKGGFCAIAPVAETKETKRRYVDGTMVLETCFRTADGEARLYDFFAMDSDVKDPTHPEHVRLIEGISGCIEFHAEISPRFDFGEIVPHVREHGEGIYSAIGSNVGLVIRANTRFDVMRDRGLSTVVAVKAGERVRISICFTPPEQIDDNPAILQPDGDRVDTAFDRTCAWWREWMSRITLPQGPDEHTVRSAIVLKSLSFERTGAIVAAPTTSLPESMGAERNWDYRFSWVRDSVFTVRALYELGCEREADRFLKFVQRSSAGSAVEMQIMYAVDGKRRLTEVELHWLEGYGGSRPVRIGNFASEQTQLDIYGEILEMAWEGHAKGREIDTQYWNFLSDVVNMTAVKWKEKDHGIWEFRDEPRHFVHSKVMCWSALDRGIRLAQENRLPAPLDNWAEARDAVRAAIEREGYDSKRGVFVQAFENQYLDAALLLLPRTGFVDYNDPRMVRTTDAIHQQLNRNGLLDRYDSPDGLPGNEGAFVPCTFWLVRCLAYQGKTDMAWDYYRQALGCANELGLFSEEYDAARGRMLGNFPQALTHVSQITARLALEKAKV